MKIGIVQTGPIYYDLSRSLEKAMEIIDKAGKYGVQLLVFGECWLTGYPAWLDHCPNIGIWDHPPVKEVWRQMYENSITIEGPELKSLCAAAKAAKLDMVIGCNESIRHGKGNGSLYNSVITINRSGSILNHHRKLMPTYTERLVHATGDGFGLRSVQTENGSLGTLICWEHWMPLARQSMHDQGEDIHVALWPNVMEMHQLASRHYAFEGRCIVIAAGQIQYLSDFPTALELPDHLKNNPSAMILKGGSCIFGPDGDVLLEPQLGTDDLIVTDIPEPASFIGEHMNLSVSGHYQRHDIFSLEVNRKRLTEEN